jgi:hypothetical protein
MTLERASIWPRALAVAAFAIVVLLPFALDRPVVLGLGLCKISGDLPECAIYRISQPNKNLVVTNNCDYTIQVYLDRGGGYCPAQDARLAAYTKSEYRTDICTYQSVRFCE